MAGNISCFCNGKILSIVSVSGICCVSDIGNCSIGNKASTVSQYVTMLPLKKNKMVVKFHHCDWLWHVTVCFAVLLWLHLCHVGGDEGAPVPTVQVELGEP